MQVSRNEKLIKRRSRLGSYATLAGLGVLVAGMIASFQPQYLQYSLIALILGFILSQYGNYNLRRWGRAPRPDQMLETALKGFDDRYHLYSWSLPAPFVLLTPQGLYSFTTRDQSGQISVEGAKWRSKWTIGRALMVFAQEGLGNPTREAIEDAARLEKWLKQALPDMQVAIQPAVVFVNEKVELETKEPAVPVVEIGNLKKWLRGGGKGENIRNADFKALEQLFDGTTVGKNG